MLNKSVREFSVTTSNFDIAIIGGGIIGLALARALQSSKANVAIIDRRDGTPPATIAAAGMLAPSFESAHGASESLYAFCANSLAMWPGFADAITSETGLDVDYRAHGILGVALDELEAQKLAAEATALIERGAAVEQLTGDETRKLEPALSDKIEFALYAKNDAQVDPRKMLVALRASVAEKATLISARCTDIQKKKEGDFVVTLDNGDSCHVQKVVLATGVAGNLFNGATSNIYPVKGEATALAMPDALLRCVVRAPGAYICPKADQRLVIGATELPHRDDAEIDDAAIEGLKRNGAVAAPALGALKEIERWSGLRPATPDGAPILGSDPQGPEGLFLALGHHRNGVLMAPATAAALVSELLGGPPDPAIADFRPDRFSGPKYG